MATWMGAMGGGSFGARTVVASAVLAAALLAASTALAQLQQQQQQQQVGADGCRIECYPNTKMINGKGGAGKGDNCRWILRTDGKPARLCDHIKCSKVCPQNNRAAAAAGAQADQQEAAASSLASDNLRIEQQLERDTGAGGESGVAQPMGIMRQLHGAKLAKAPVPGLSGGRLAGQQQQQQQHSSPAAPGRRMAPTLPPSVQYDENDTPPPISRFLDISPEE